MAYPGRLLGRDIAHLRREMDRLFRDVGPDGSRPHPGRAVWSPRVDLAETDDAFVVTFDLPGVNESDVALTIEDDTLRVAGERRFAGEGSNQQYLRIERRYGRFFRSIQFTRPIDAGGVTAEMDAGVLTVRVPKAEASKPQRIEVRRRDASTGNGDGS